MGQWAEEARMSDIIDLTAAERRMQGAVESVRSNFATIRTGRANPSLLDRIEVEAYGTKMDLRSVANVGVPEPRLLTVTPFDPNSLKDIERAVRDADIGLNPQNDGKILRLPIPELTEERRRELIRMARSMAEEGKVSVRNVRRDEMRDVHELRREGEVSEDDERRAEAELQKLTDGYVKRPAAIPSDQEAELRERRARRARSPRAASAALRPSFRSSRTVTSSAWTPSSQTKKLSSWRSSFW